MSGDDWPTLPKNICCKCASPATWVDELKAPKTTYSVLYCERHKLYRCKPWKGTP